ncbi:MAG TPA: hypothetical protein VK574_17540 [Terracidiphilus sp.]|nr:hypothetical protein [Terracidiphilus sp.]
MMRTSGRLDDPSPVKPEMQGKGRPEFFIAGAAGEGESNGATRNSAETSNAKGMLVRGNSNGPSPAQPKARSRRAT